MKKGGSEGVVVCNAHCPGRGEDGGTEVCPPGMSGLGKGWE